MPQRPARRVARLGRAAPSRLGQAAPSRLEPVRSSDPSQARREADRQRRAFHPWRKWYSTKAWRERRAAQLAAEPLCRRCAARERVVAAVAANHIQAHRGDWDLFIRGPLESLCKHCHDSEVQREERAAWLGATRGGSNP